MAQQGQKYHFTPATFLSLLSYTKKSGKLLLSEAFSQLKILGEFIQIVVDCRGKHPSYL